MPPHTRSSHWRYCLAGAAVLFSVTLALYLPAIRFEFLNWDDLTYVVDNENLKGGFSWTGVVWAFKAFHSANWHPVTWLSHMLDCEIFGLNPAGHHFTNALLHALNSVLLFIMLLRLLGAGANVCGEATNKHSQSQGVPWSHGPIVLWSSFFIAAVFALHPLRVESVAWVSERKDLLSGTFFILTLWAYGLYVTQRRKDADLTTKNAKNTEGDAKGTTGLSDNRTIGRGHKKTKGPSDLQNSVPSLKSYVLSPMSFYVLALTFFALGLMSKPMLVTVPFVLLLLDFWPLKRWDFERLSTLKRMVIEKAPFFVLTLISCLITFLAQRSGGAVASTAMIPLSVRMQNALVSYVHYIQKLVWPDGLSPLYPYNLEIGLGLVIGAGAVLLVVTVAAWTLRERRPWFLVGWLWYLGMLVPVIGIVQVGSQAFADRYTYLPMIGLGVAAVFQITSVAASTRGRWAVAAIMTCILAGFGFVTSGQLHYWKNTSTLFGRALGLDPKNVQALYAVGTDLVEKGELDRGKEFLERAIQLRPDYPEALGAIGSIFDGKNDYKAAVRFYNAALKVAPNHDAVLNNLAWLLAACPDPAFRDGKEAVRLATRACELTRYSKPIYIGTLAAAHAEAGEFDTAVATAERAAKLADALNLHETAARNRELIERYRDHKTAGH